MPSPRTPRHVAGGPPATPPTPARRRSGERARHLRSAPRAAAAVTGGVAAVLLLGPSAGLVAATATGGLGPEHADRIGSVVAALRAQVDPAAGEQLAERSHDAASRTLPDRADAPTAPAPAPSAPDGGDADAAPPAEDVLPTPSVEPAPEPEATDDAPAPDAAPETDDAPEGTPAPAPSLAAAATPDVATGSLSAPGAAVVELTNAERAAAGCAPLAVDERLTAAAQLHSEDMLAQDYFDHTSLDGRSPWDRAKAQGYENPGAENIAKGQATAEDVVRAWMDSPGHRANILNCDLQEIGVGYADRVWTQLFGWG